MLPISHRQHYERLKLEVEKIDRTVSDAEGDRDRTALKLAIGNIQAFFQQQILNLPAEDLEPGLQHHVQSYQVEIDKQLRLLGMDVMFLQAARQAATAEQRRTQVRDRLATLLRYCHVLLKQTD